MAYLTKKQVEQIVKNAPAGTSPAGVVSALRAQGHQLEGYPSQDQEKKMIQGAQKTEERRNVLQKTGSFLGIEKFGQGIGTAVNNLTGGTRRLEESFNRLQEQSTDLLQKYKEARDSGDRQRTDRIMAQLKDVDETMKSTATAIGDVGTGGLSNKEFLGSAALTLGNVATAGLGASGRATIGSLGATRGAQVSSVLPELAKPLVRDAGKLAYVKSLGGNIGRSAALGGAMGAAGGAEQDESMVRAAGLGLLIGGAIPAALEVGRAGVKGVQAGSRLLAKTFAQTPDKAIDYAIQNPKGVREGIQRAINDEKTVFKVANAANKAASNIEAKRNSNFQKGLNKLSEKLKGQPIDPEPFNTRLKRSLQRFDVITPDGRINPESIISDPRELKDIQGILTRMKNQKNLTPEGWWNLKRFVSNKYRPTASGEYNALITDISEGLREEMVSNVKGFDKVLAGYEADSTLLQFLKKELGVSSRARGLEVGGDETVLIQDNTKRVINALRRAMQDNQPLANEMVKELERVGGKELMDDLAGMYFASIIPRGGLQTALGLGAGSIATAGAALTGGVGAAGATLPLLGFASPRVVGESAALYGQISQGLRNVSPEIQQLIQGAGRSATYGAGIPNISK